MIGPDDVTGKFTGRGFQRGQIGPDGLRVIEGRLMRRIFREPAIECVPLFGLQRAAFVETDDPFGRFGLDVVSSAPEHTHPSIPSLG